MADGSIKISTKIGTEGFEKGRKRLEQGMEKLSSSMKRLAGSTFGAGNATSKAFESARLKAQDAEIAISEVEKKMKAVREASMGAGAESGKAFQKAKLKADDLNKSLSELYAQRDALAQNKLEQSMPHGMKLSELPDDFADKTLSKDIDIKAIDKQISVAEKRLEGYKAKMREAKAAGNGLTDEAERELKSLQKKLDGLNIKLLQYRKRMEAAQGGTSNFSKIADKAKKTFRGLFGEAKRTEKQINQTSKMVGRMLSRMILFAGIALVLKSVSEGVQNIAQVSGSANATLSNLTTSFLYLKNSVAAAVMPALEMLAPMIMFITDNLASLFNMVGMVTARLFGGATTFVKAKKAQVDYAATLDKTGKAAKKTANALAAFDEINILQQNTDSEDEKVPGMPKPEEMFEEVKIPQETLAFADKIGELFDRLKQSAQPTTEAFARLWAALEPVKNFAWTALKDFYEGFLKPVGQWALGEGIPRLVDAFRNGLEKVHWERINEALQKLWKALTPFTVRIGEGLLWLWENVLVPLGTWTMNEIAPRVLEALALVIQILDSIIGRAQPALQWFWDNFLSPIAKWTGTFLTHDLDMLLGLLELVAGVLSGDLKQATEGAKKAFENFGEIIKMFFGTGAVNIVRVFTTGWINGISTWWTKDVLPWFSETRWGKALQGVKAGFAETFKDAINGVVDLINKFINGLNKKLHFQWDALKVAGKELIPAGSFQLFSVSNIPRLATGAVIPPNSEFMAILGDQKSGTNIEAPLSTIEQALRNVMREMGGSGDGDTVINNRIILDGEVVYDNQQRVTRRRGTRLINGVT